jgi:pimeloyl-[acyl-carrier protein] methyl ester esterase
MSCHVEIIGQGQPLVMLHGWGMHSGVWQHLVKRLFS